MKFRYAVLAWALITGAAVYGPMLADQPPVSRAGRAMAYQPGCEGGDLVCNAWEEFRRSHPFPYQSIQGKRLKDGSFAIMLFEPAPVMSKAALDQLIKSAFGKDLVALRRLRWRMGADGWLEDVVLNVHAPPAAADALQDSVLRDRVAFLHLALFGTTFGSSLDMQTDPGSVTEEVAAPNLKLTPRELKQWLSEPSLRWSRLDADHDIPQVSWQVIASQQKTGTFAASDRSLVLLAFPSQMLRSAQLNSEALEPLRSAFRCFAVSTDEIVGGYESPNGHLAIIGRRRTHTFASVPPLRFETFELVASQTTDELSQSYERNSLFAGKLRSGEFRAWDWAPIYLSDALIDTEFGALLNTTDQLLKSWSEAGNIEYLYFTYGKPDSFPFGKRPLSQLIEEITGSERVLYNWNTAGSAVLVADSPSKVMTTRQTGALPVTYGAQAQAHRGMETGKLLTQEEQAYQYFANRKDANLERVVQYTLLYQFCRAVMADSHTAGAEARASAQLAPEIKASREAAGVRVRATVRLLDDVQAGRIRTEPALQDELQRKLRAIRTRYPAFTNQQLASIMADRFSAESKRIRDERVARLEAMGAQLRKAFDDYNARVRQYNESIRTGQIGALLLAQSVREDLEKRKLEIKRMEQDLLNAGKDDPFNDAREILQIAAVRSGNLEEVRGEFVAKHVYEPFGAIKTPSIVVSWDSHDVTAVGGHNIDARTLRLEPSKSVANMALEETDKGFVLKYNPLKASIVEGRASDLARAVEHGGVRDVTGLSKILAEGPPVRRLRTAALELPKSTEAAQTREVWSARMGKRVYTEKSQFVDDFRLIAEKNDCCVFVVHDENEVAFATEQNLKPPPRVIVHEIRDTPSMNEYLRGISNRAGTKGERSVVFFDTPESHVHALGINAAESPRVDLADMAEALGGRRMGGTEPRDSGILARDLSGRESVLKSVANVTESKIKALFSRIALREPAVSWTRAEVSVLERASAERFAADLGWLPERDGIPAAVSLKFGRVPKPGTPGGLPPVDVAVTAGFAEPDYAAGQAKLLAAHERNLQAAAARQASIAQYTMTIRNELKQMPDIKLRRLTIVVKDGETRTLLSWRIEPEPPTGHEPKRLG